MQNTPVATTLILVSYLTSLSIKVAMKCSSTTSVGFQQTAWRITEDRPIHNLCCENLKPYKMCFIFTCSLCGCLLYRKISCLLVKVHLFINTFSYLTIIRFFFSEVCFYSLLLWRNGELLAITLQLYFTLLYLGLTQFVKSTFLFLV